MPTPKWYPCAMGRVSPLGHRLKLSLNLGTYLSVEGTIMSLRQVALYARVSSESQAQAQTVQSQLTALRERLTQDGGILSPEHEFVDEGYSGSTLIRPALERLPDAVAAAEVERI